MKIKVGQKYRYQVGSCAKRTVKILKILEMSNGETVIKYRYGFLGPVLTDRVNPFKSYLDIPIIVKELTEI